ncbi:unnamed protein product [Closterium sp. NIES-53]
MSPTPFSDSLHDGHPVVSHIHSSLVTYPTAPSQLVSALVAAVSDFASSHGLDYTTQLVSGSAHSPSLGGAPAFDLGVLEDRQFELAFLAAIVPHLCASLLTLEGDLDALEIPTPLTHAKTVSRPWAFQCIATDEAEMASYRSTSTNVDTVPPPEANVDSGMWIYNVKRPPRTPSVFNARYYGESLYKVVS